MSEVKAVNSKVDYGQLLIGSRRRQVLHFVNRDTPVIPVNGFGPAVSPDGGFRGASNVSHLAGSLDPGTGVGVPIDFVPQRPGPYTGTFVLFVAQPHTCEGVDVEGWGVGFEETGAIALEELFHKIDTLLDCGVVVIGEAGTAKFELRNTSASDITVAAAWQKGQDFFVTNLPPITLEAGMTLVHGTLFDTVSTTTIEVRFVPQFDGESLDVLRIADASGAHSFAVAVKGIGITLGDRGAFSAAAVGGASNAIDFGNVVVGNSRWAAFYVTNDSDEDIYFEAKVLRGDQEFSMTAPQPSAQFIRARDQLGFVVRFNPYTVGSFEDALVIASPGGRHAVARKLRGRGVTELDIAPHGE